MVDYDCFFLKLYFFIAILHQNTVEYITCKSFLFISQKESLDSIQRYFAFADLSIVFLIQKSGFRYRFAVLCMLSPVADPDL